VDFLPHTTEDDRAMLESIGVRDIVDLFEGVPAGVRIGDTLDVPGELSEIELTDHLTQMAARSKGTKSLTCFAGGGSYDHYVPAAVKALASRAEFATSYTPYQPELSQGVLQALFEFQTVVCELYGLEVANASVYDGANALTEAVNLAVRVKKRDRAVVSGAVHPHYIDVLKTYTSGLGIAIDVVPPADDGVTHWDGVGTGDAAAVVVASPNIFGLVEDIGEAVAAAESSGALAIAVADPTAMGIFKPPGELGADVAVGEGIALGNPISYGGPGAGLFATKLELVRQVPGRIAGETVDADGRRAFVLTLQAREQHIRRAKATSNVCTNQTLMAIAAAIHLCWLGPEGLRRLGELCLRRTSFAADRLADLPGCRIVYTGTRFKEFVIETPVPAADLVAGLAARGYLAGPDLGRWYPDLANCLLVAVTERRTEDEILGFAEALEKELAGR
jgi:glycine dehydrogenase subunit 1